MPRQIPKVGDIFTVPLSNDTRCFGQILEIEPILMNSITCAFFDLRSSEDIPEIELLELSEEKILSCQFVTRDLFNRGAWKRIGNKSPIIAEALYPFRETKMNGWIGAKVIGSGIVEGFLNAYFGFGDWQEMNDPEYYNKLLFKDRKGPKLT
jgi:hypothetical protein